MNFIVSASTDVGTAKSTNQDSYNLRILNGSCGTVVFAVLCDGMGGLSMGEVASASLVMAFNEWSDTRLIQLCNEGITDSDIRSDWVAIAVGYNEKIKKYGADRGVRLGTTLTAMLLTEQKYYIINIGDTRAYEVSNGIRILTRDHSLVERELSLGLITEEQARVDPRRNVLLQCVGASETVSPDIFTGEVKPDTVYLLCSDGFRREITDDEIFEFFDPTTVFNEDDLKNSSLNLIELNKERKERDNITVLTVKAY